MVDIHSLHSDILTAIPKDPETTHLLQLASNPIYPRWSIDDFGLLRLDNRIYIPNIDDLRLRVLWTKHDHPIAGHFGQNKTLELIRREYTWPELWSFVREYCRSCTVCARAKVPRHRPYGTLKQLPIPEKPWNSISMDFIEQLLESSNFTSILVVVDRLSKQAVFIPTHDTITYWPSSSYFTYSPSTEFPLTSLRTEVRSSSPTSSSPSDKL
jgi:hypothetical protein